MTTVAETPSIAFKVEYVALTGDIVSALVLSQLVYWFSKTKTGKSRLRLQKDGVEWVAKSHKGWETEVGVSRKQLSRTLTNLESLGLIRSEIRMFSGAPTCHLNLNMRVLRTKLQGISDTPIATKRNKPLCPKVTIDCTQKVQSYTETTTKTTTDTLCASFAIALKTPKELFNVSQERAMSTAKEIISKMVSTPKPLPKSLSVVWLKEVAKLEKGFTPGLTMKQTGQLSLMSKKLGGDKELAASLLSFIVASWQEFTWQAKADAGLSLAPEQPQVGFLLTHLGTAKQLMDKSLQKTIKPQAQFLQSLAKIDPLPQKLDPVIKPNNMQVTMADIQATMAALAAAGKK